MRPECHGSPKLINNQNLAFASLVRHQLKNKDTRRHPQPQHPSHRSPNNAETICDGIPQCPSKMKLRNPGVHYYPRMTQPQRRLARHPMCHPMCSNDAQRWPQSLRAHGSNLGERRLDIVLFLLSSAASEGESAWGRGAAALHWCRARARDSASRCGDVHGGHFNTCLAVKMFVWIGRRLDKHTPNHLCRDIARIKWACRERIGSSTLVMGEELYRLNVLFPSKLPCWMITETTGYHGSHSLPCCHPMRVPR